MDSNKTEEALEEATAALNAIEDQAASEAISNIASEALERIAAILGESGNPNTGC